MPRRDPPNAIRTDLINSHSHAGVDDLLRGRPRRARTGLFAGAVAAGSPAPVARPRSAGHSYSAAELVG